jgi:hypothetical protein
VIRSTLSGRASHRAYIFRRVKHHYVPAFYLRGFVDAACPPGHTPCVWLVDLGNGKIKCKSPENAAAITDYYAVGDRENRQDVEKYLSAVESQTAPVITRILGDYDTSTRTTRPSWPTSRPYRSSGCLSFVTVSRSSLRGSPR